MICVAVFAAFCVTASTNGAATQDEKVDNDVLQRKEITLIELTQDEAEQLNSKSGKKILSVERFNPKVLSVKAMSPTQLSLTAFKPGITKMKIKYEDGETEQLLILMKGMIED